LLPACSKSLWGTVSLIPVEKKLRGNCKEIVLQEMGDSSNGYQVAVEVARVQPRERQAVAVSRQGRFRRGHRWPRRRREQVVEQPVRFVAGNPSALKPKLSFFMFVKNSHFLLKILKVKKFDRYNGFK
jgi:hypothetical protein